MINIKYHYILIWFCSLWCVNSAHKFSNYEHVILIIEYLLGAMVYASRAMDIDIIFVIVFSCMGESKLEDLITKKIKKIDYFCWLGTGHWHVEAGMDKNVVTETRVIKMDFFS